MQADNSHSNSPQAAEQVKWPLIIQGGMGAGVSHWKLARAVAQTGQLGVVSGTALDTLLMRRLQQGDPDGKIRHALEAFPFPAIRERILNQYLNREWKGERKRFQLGPMPSHASPQSWIETVVAAHFCEIFLAKEGLEGKVGLNLMEKLQVPTLPSLFGAMMAGVDYILMGAGIPTAIPEALDNLARGEPASIPLHVEGATPGNEYHLKFDPRPWLEVLGQPVKRPHFLPIVSTHTLAQALLRKSKGAIYGFIIENYQAGGHNTPPRNRNISPDQPLYGEKDNADLEKLKALGLPFWLAGNFIHPKDLEDAQKAGAVGIQSGTPFAFCRDSGLDPKYRLPILERARREVVHVKTDLRASPTGFPFKVIEHPGTLSEKAVYESRQRCCDLGYLRRPVQGPDGKLIYRCPSEPVEDYLRKGGDIEDTVDRKCLCNGLLAAIGIGQIYADGAEEPAILTAGDCLSDWVKNGPAKDGDYSAADVVAFLLGQQPTADKEAECSAAG